MSKTSGFVLLAAGLAAAAYVLPWGGDTGGPDLIVPFTDATRLLPASGASEVAVVAPEPHTYVEPAPPATPAQERQAVPPFSAPVVITLAQRPSEPSAPSLHNAGVLPRDRDSLARELQKELKRVGCYEGELNGTWTPSTRQAMKAFTDRVNATLPTDDPDSILLTLVQAYQDKVCGKSCPVGQGLSDGGRCVPTSILARAAKKGVPPPPRATASGEKLSPAITAWSTTTTAATPTPGPAVAPAATPAGAPAVAAPPTDGRMALAGPAGPEVPATGAAPTPPATTPVATAPKRTPKVSEGGWARNLFKNQQSLN